MWQSDSVDPNGQLTQVLQTFSTILILFTSGLGFVVEVKMIAARHDEAVERMEFDNPLDADHVENHNEEAQDMMDLADAMK